MIHDFHIDRRLGEGGMGEVWSARHTSSDREVAIKFLRGDLARRDEDNRQFRREVEAMASLDHLGIVSVLDVGVLDDDTSGFRAGTPWFAMEIARGGAVDQASISTFPELARLLLDVLDALAYAHARGFVHRDLKPENLLLAGETDRWRPVITDLGLAHQVDPHDPRTLTGLDEVTGTPAYMAPEQFKGDWRNFGPWTDLYALGVMAWEMASGRIPFHGRSVVEMAMKHFSEPLPALVAGFAVPPGFEGWLQRCTQKPIEDRFTSAAEASWSLLALIGDDPRWLPSAGLMSADRRLATDQTLGALTLDFGTQQLNHEQLAAVVTLDRRQDAQAMPILRPPLPAKARQFEAGSTRPQATEGIGLQLLGIRKTGFVGRSQEREQLWRHLRASCDGQPRCVLLRGPSGVGKTRLARWLTTRAAEVGAARTIFARHDRTASSLHGLLRALRVDLGLLGLEGHAAFDRVREVFSRWAPAAMAESDVAPRANRIAQLLVPGARGPDLPLIRFESVREGHNELVWLLRTMSRHRPVIIVLDDLQYGDDSLDFLKIWLRESRSAPAHVLIVATAEAPTGAHDPLAPLLELAQPQGVESIVLEPLAEADCIEVVRSLLDLEEASLHRLVRLTGGRLAHVSQVLLDLVDQRKLRATDEGFVIDDPSMTAEFDTGATRLMRQLVSRAGHPDAEQAIELAAALGNHVLEREWIAACHATGLTAGPHIIDAAARLGVVERFEHGFSFAQSHIARLIREHARLTGRWRSHHQAIASLSLAAPASGAPVHGRYVYHLRQAGNEADALTQQRLQVDAEMTRSNYRAAIGLAEDCDRRLSKLGVARDEASRVALLALMIDAHRYVGRIEDADELMQLHKTRVISCVDPVARANVYRAFGNTAFFRQREQEGEAWFMKALDEQAGGDPVLLAKICHGLGWVCGATGRLDRAIAYFDEGIRAASGAGNAGQADRAWNLQGKAECFSRLHDPRGESLAREAVALFAQLGSRAGWAAGAFLVGDFARYRGDADLARRTYLEAHQTLVELGHPLQSLVLGRLSVLELLQDRPTVALKYARQVYRRTRNLKLPSRVIIVLVLALLEPDDAVAAAHRDTARPLVAAGKEVHADVGLLVARLGGL